MSNRINLVRGTTLQLAIDLVDAYGEVYPLAALVDATGEFTLRTTPTAVTDVLAFTTVTMPTRLAFATDAAVLNLTLDGADSVGLDLGLYYYQVQIVLAAGERYDVIPWNVLDLNLGGAAAEAPPVFDNTVAITADYPLSGDMTYATPGGSPIVGAQVRVYRKSAYDAGDLTTPVGVTVTDAAGKWTQPILVVSGYTYLARFEKPNEYGPDVKEFFA